LNGMYKDLDISYDWSLWQDSIFVLLQCTSVMEQVIWCCDLRNIKYQIWPTFESMAVNWNCHYRGNLCFTNTSCLTISKCYNCTYCVCTRNVELNLENVFMKWMPQQKPNADEFWYKAYWTSSIPKNKTYEP
jgi:hypothetical protein